MWLCLCVGFCCVLVFVVHLYEAPGGATKKGATQKTGATYFLEFLEFWGGILVFVFGGFVTFLD